MGIDPLTHKPLSTIDDQQPQVKINQQEQDPSMTKAESVIDQNNKEPETSLQSSITEINKEEDKVTSMTSSTLLFDHIDATTMEIMNNNFCTDDVPLIEPHEILVPCSTSTTPSSSCSYSSENSFNNKFLEEWQFQDFEWADASDNYGSINNNINMSLWDDHLSNWDLLINDDDDFAASATFSQCPRMDLDQDSWKFGLL